MTLARRLAFDLATRLNPRANLLTSLANLYGTDKGTGRRGHHYTRIYSELLEPLRDRPIRMLEIGLLGMRRGGWDDKQLRDKGETHGRDAPSLRMWSRYFPRGEIFGLDFNDFTAVKIERCKIFRADASRPDELRAIGMRSAANSMSSSTTQATRRTISRSRLAPCSRRSSPAAFSSSRICSFNPRTGSRRTRPRPSMS